MKRFFYLRLTSTRIAVADVSPTDFGMELAADRVYEINRINVPEAFRGQGHARTLLKQVLDEADKEEITLRLHAFGSGSLSTKQLVSWYKRYGFVQMNSGYLMRKPR